MSQFLAGGIIAGLGMAGAVKLDEGNWAECYDCGCGKCQWDAGSFVGKLATVGLNNDCAFKKCVCGHHFTRHRRN